MISQTVKFEYKRGAKTNRLSVLLAIQNFSYLITSIVQIACTKNDKHIKITRLNKFNNVSLLYDLLRYTLLEIVVYEM